MSDYWNKDEWAKMSEEMRLIWIAKVMGKDKTRIIYNWVRLSSEESANKTKVPFIKRKNRA